MRVASALPVLVAGVTAQGVKGPYEQCGGQGYADAACQNGWQCTTYNPWYAQCVPAATSTPAGGIATSATTTTRPTTTSASSSSPTTTLVTIITTAPTTTTGRRTTTTGLIVDSSLWPTPTALQSGWYWIRAVAEPNFHSYLQPQATAAPSLSTNAPAIIASAKNAAQYNVASGQLIQNRFGNGPNLYLHVENPTDKTQRTLKTWFETTPNTYGAFAFQGDTLVWSVADINRPNTAAWLVCGTGKELFVNTGAYLYNTPAGCSDHTIHSYGGSLADV
ncbi:hypothetical protein QBC42DRAFT_330229 [Cladorrhinum samala]|uniref:CBM1 domain-containing protein n=1 Tax=Cladorrhinum samala TaxID=585594 RepID=A0AAV9HKM8_9PEZI|nr:hypothetical protein QBC42DRAFT_330229 [Cladorrhinum samala]